MTSASQETASEVEADRTSDSLRERDRENKGVLYTTPTPSMTASKRPRLSEFRTALKAMDVYTFK